MGSTVPHSRALYEAARSELCEVRMATGENAHLAVLVGTDVVHLERLHSDRLMKRVMRSMKSPTHATSTGKVLLAYAAPEISERVIAQGLDRYTTRTVTDPSEFRTELAVIRARGYALNREEFRRGTSSVAVPVFAKDGKAVAAMAVITPATILFGLKMENILRVLKESAARISRTAQ
jgi:DNA-binding IclR family transcriptional regulator